MMNVQNSILFYIVHVHFTIDRLSNMVGTPALMTCMLYGILSQILHNTYTYCVECRPIPHLITHTDFIQIYQRLRFLHSASYKYNTAYT